MKHFLLKLILFTIVLSCSKEQNNVPIACNSDAPIETALWFQELKESITNCGCEISIVQATYMNQTVVYVAMTDPLCDGIFPPPAVYDCNGDPYIFPTQKDQAEFYYSITDIIVLYRCKLQIM